MNKVEQRFNGSIEELKCALCGKVLLRYNDFEIYDILESGYSSEVLYNHIVKECSKTER